MSRYSFICFLCIAAMLSGLLCGCSATQQPITDFSIHELTDYWDDEKTDQSFPEETTTLFDGQLLIGTLVSVHHSSNACIPEASYRTADGASFDINAHGEITAVALTPANGDGKCSEAECAEIAEQYFKQLSGLFCHEYEIVRVDQRGEPTEDYTFHFAKRANGYDTTDYMSVTVTSSGAFKSYYASEFGHIAKKDCFAFDEAALKATVAQAYSEYTVDHIFYTHLPNGKVALLVSLMPATTPNCALTVIAVPKQNHS